MKLQVLAVTMHQDDHSLLQKMNIQSDILVGNQCSRDEIERFSYHGHQVGWYSFRERGVGLNRNHLLMRAEGDICLFADDDITYLDGYADRVLQAFREHPDADAIMFGLQMTRDGAVYRHVEPGFGRAHVWNSMKYETSCLAFRNDAIRKHNLVFSRLFGGGCLYGSGEDSLFIKDCLRAGLKIYTYPYTLGYSAKDTSTWFTGYNRKYFYDEGAWLSCAFPHTKYLLQYYFALRLCSRTELPLGQILREIKRGMKGYRTLTPFTEA